jgi:prevent-host-death family protein
MTINGYNVTMYEVKIAELKSRLSEHLRKVRAGRTLTVLDRSTPIARIVPWKESDASFETRQPSPGAPALKDVPLPSPLSRRGDIVKLLLEDRQRDR